MKILVLGDSITFGHGCKDRMFYWDDSTKRYIGDADSFQYGPSDFCWASLLKSSTCSVTNLSRSGNNNTNIAWQALEAVSTGEKYDFIFAHFSYDDRIEFAHPDHPDNNELISISPLHTPDIYKRINSDWDKASESYRNNLFHPGWGVKLTHMAIHAVANIAQLNGARYYWSAPEFNATHSSSLLGKDIRNLQLTSIIEKFDVWDPTTATSRKNSPYVAVDGHPSELAHQEYCNQVIKPLLE